MLLRVKVPAYSWKPLLASTTHWSPTGKQWQCEFASQPSKYLNTAQSWRTVLPQSHDHQGFHWLLSPLPRCLNILLALLPPSLWPLPLLPPLFRAGKNKWEVPPLPPVLSGFTVRWHLAAHSALRCGGRESTAQRRFSPQSNSGASCGSPKKKSTSLHGGQTRTRDKSISAGSLSFPWSSSSMSP